jgi:hypothetical protein
MKVLLLILFLAFFGGGGNENDGEEAVRVGDAIDIEDVVDDDENSAIASVISFFSLSSRFTCNFYREKVSDDNIPL